MALCCGWSSLSIGMLLRLTVLGSWDLGTNSAKPLHQEREFAFNEPVLQLFTQGNRYARLCNIPEGAVMRVDTFDPPLLAC